MLAQSRLRKNRASCAQHTSPGTTLRSSRPVFRRKVPWCCVQASLKILRSDPSHLAWHHVSVTKGRFSQKKCALLKIFSVSKNASLRPSHLANGIEIRFLPKNTALRSKFNAQKPFATPFTHCLAPRNARRGRFLGQKFLFPAQFLLKTPVLALFHAI